MNWKTFGLLSAAVGAGTLVYGCLVESKHLVIERKKLFLKKWPKKLSGYKIALIADLHLKDKYTLEVAHRAAMSIVEEDPDMAVIAGDFVGYWKPKSEELVKTALHPLSVLDKPVIGVPGNHEYDYGQYQLDKICEDLNIKLLKNECWNHDGINWIGIDSFNANRAKPHAAIEQIKNRQPAIVVWHEPDLVDQLPIEASLMLSGHSHGGQYLFPFGIAPMTPKNGQKYVRGFFPNTKTPLYVTRGVGTTGPPSRFLCPPEVSILELYPMDKK